MPATSRWLRLFDQSPVGQNATGESDLRNYYDWPSQANRKGALREPLELLLDIMCRSELGMAIARRDAGLFAAVAVVRRRAGNNRRTITDTIIRARSRPDPAANRAARNAAAWRAAGHGTNISEEDFAAATVPMPPAPEDSRRLGAR